SPHHLFRIMHGQNQHLRLRGFLHDLARRLQAVKLGHADVHNGYFGLESPDHLHGLPARGGFAHHLPASPRLEQRSQATADHFMVVGQQNAKGAHALPPWSGKIIFNVVPRSPGSISTRPPSSRARSCILAMPTPSFTSPLGGIPLRPWSLTTARTSVAVTSRWTLAVLLRVC